MSAVGRGITLMRTLLLVFLVVSFAGCTSMLLGSGGASAGRPIGSDSRSASDAGDDARISATIRNRFAGDSELAAARLQVATMRGVVSLKGTVPAFEQRDRAVRLAQDVEGVVRVENQLVVRRP